MVQFNLLPDVKVQYLKVKRQQHAVALIATVASVIALVIFAISFSVVYGVQKKNISNLQKSISSDTSQLEGTKDLTKILTVQNQLQTLPNLDNSKVVSSRLFAYLTQVTPANASIATLDADFTANTIEVTGSAPDLETVNEFVDTLKYTQYTDSTSSSKQAKNAFSAVVLSSFSRDSQGATYTIGLSFDPTIFQEGHTITLTVPPIIPTRSQVNNPGNLFQ